MQSRLIRANRLFKKIMFAVVVTAALALGAWYCRGRFPQATYSAKSGNPAPRTDWSTYNGGLTGDHYSPLDQITAANVSHLKQVWRFDSGTDGGVQANSLVVGRTLYGYGPTLQVIALDGATGKQLWQFNSGIVGRQPSRGLTYWSDGKESKLFAYILNFLYALDPVTGQPIGAFGENGRLDMRKDLDSDYTQNSVALTTPGVLCGDLLVLGFRAPETHPAPRGDIRAYNVRTGKLAWAAFTRFRIPVKRAIRRGLGARGSLPAPPTTGRVCRSTKHEESCMYLLALPCPTFMVRTELATIFLPTLWLPSTSELGRCSGTFKVYITISGTGISHLLRHS